MQHLSSSIRDTKKTAGRAIHLDGPKLDGFFGMSLSTS